MKYKWLWAAILSLAQPLNIAAQDFKEAPISSATTWAYDALNLPQLESQDVTTITIAIVDAGFRMDHEAYAGFIQPSLTEVLNGIDDDGNGFVDDIKGWDVADNDADVAAPAGREEFFSHGTQVAGAVAEVLKRSFGSRAKDIFRFLLIKARKDGADKKFILSGYDGIDYAVKSGADIILCAWSGGEYDPTAHDRIFAQAEEKGILIIGAAGNFYSEKCDPPSSVNSVYAISAVDSSFRKTEKSNYGAKIWLSAPGDLVLSAYPTSPKNYMYFEETSAASSIITGCAATLMAVDPRADSDLVMEALLNTSTPVDKQNPRITGRLGSGFPDLTRAYEYLINSKERDKNFNPSLSKGILRIDKNVKRKEWKIRPHGPYKGFNVKVDGNWSKANSPMAIAYDSSYIIISSLALTQIPEFLPCDSMQFSYDRKHRSMERRVYYEAVPIDSSSLYCDDIVYLSNDKGEVTDGSGDLEYTNKSGCKWVIKVSDGKRIKLDFSEFDTEIHKDEVMVFHGSKPLQESMIAKFSGPTLPPVLVTGHNEILVWFLTNENITKQGWTFTYEATDEPPGSHPKN